MPALSVVIPVLDDAVMLRACLTALAVQTRPADEIIVVDNGSVDDSADVGHAAGARVIRVGIPGIPAATAAGFDAAAGEILVRLDADSVPPPDWLARIEAALDDPSRTAITGTGAFYGGSSASRWLGRRVYLAGYFAVMGRVLGHPPLFGSNFALRRTAWLRVRGAVHRTLATVHDDLDLSYQLTADMRVVYDPTLVVGVSARPFASWRAIGRRMHWAYVTIVLNERQQPGRRRRAARRAAQRERERASSAQSDAERE